MSTKNSLRKRRYYRHPVETPCVFQIVPGTNPHEIGPPCRGLLKNLSLGGLQVATNVIQQGNLYVFNELKLHPGLEFKPNLLRLRFFLPGQTDPFLFYCQPRWYCQGILTDPFDYYIGVRFCRARKDDLVRIMAYIQHHGDQDELMEFVRQTTEEANEKTPYRERINSRADKCARAELPLTYRVVTGDKGQRSRVESGTSRNLSLTGLCAGVMAMNIDEHHLVFDQTPLNRNYVEVDIFMPRQNRPVSALGEVRWFERCNTDGRYRYDVGIRFLKISDHDRQLIAEYIKGKPAAGTGIQRVW